MGLILIGDFFLCPTLVSCRSVHFSQHKISFTPPDVYHYAKKEIRALSLTGMSHPTLSFLTVSQLYYNYSLLLTNWTFFCPSHNTVGQAFAQTMCVLSEQSSLVSFDPVFIEIFHICKLIALSCNYRPYYDIFLISSLMWFCNQVTKLISLQIND